MKDLVFLKKLGERIVELRKKKGIKQITLANELKMSATSLGRIEKGRVNSSINMLRKISNALDVELIELLKIN